MTFDVQSTTLSDGTTLEIVASGAGSPVLLLHGALGDWRTWSEVLPALGPDLRGLAMTQRGFGRRAPQAPAGFGVGRHADDLIQLVRMCALAPLRVVGWSYGADVALQAVSDRPELFAQVIAYEPGDWRYLGPDERPTVEADAAAMFGPVFAAVETGDLECAARTLIDGTAGPGGFEAQAAAARQVQVENAWTLPAQLNQEPPPPLQPGAPGREHPGVTIAWGAASRPLFSMTSRAAARWFHRATVQEVNGKGHLWPIEDPLGFASWVTSRLK